MSDLISRAEAMDASEKFIKDCNPDHFVGHQKFIEYMDNAEIGSFGKWQFANGFNMGLTAAEVAIKKLPSARPEIIRCKDCKWYEEQDETIGTCLLTESGAHIKGYCAWAEIKDDIVVIHPEDIVFNSEEDEKAYYEALGTERKEE